MIKYKNRGFTFLVFIVLVSSCKTSKNLEDKQKYFWEGKEVSKNKYDKLIYNYTVDFVNKYPDKEAIKTFLNLNVIYDTSNHAEKSQLNSID